MPIQLECYLLKFLNFPSVSTIDLPVVENLSDDDGSFHGENDKIYFPDATDLSGTTEKYCYHAQGAQHFLQKSCRISKLAMKMGMFKSDKIFP